MTPLPGTHLSFMVFAVQTYPESIFDTLTTLHAWLCTGTSSLAGDVDLAMISQTALATKLRRADNQPLACVSTLHNISDIYKVSISLIATRQQLAILLKAHQIDASDGTRCHQARADEFVGPSQYGYFWLNGVVAEIEK